MTAPPRSEPGRLFWVSMAGGGAVTLVGVGGLLTAEGNGLGSFVPWFAGGALLVDLVVVPLAAAVGLLGRRVVPAAAWPAVRGGLIASAALAAFAAPLVLDLGGRPGNASLRPRHYGSGLASALVAVWVVALVAAAASWLVARPRPGGAGVVRNCTRSRNKADTLDP